MKICVQDAGLYSVHGYKDIYKQLREVGFEAIDWNIDIELRGNMIRKGTYEGNTAFEGSVEDLLAFYAEELSAIREAGLTISQAHAPFPYYDTDFAKEDTTDYMISVYKKIILFLDRVGCKNLIVHGACRKRTGEEKTQEEIDSLNKKLYTSLIPELQQTNVTVCLENLFSKGITQGHCANPYDAAREIDELNAQAGKECFGLCVDTGHLNLIGCDQMQYFSIVGKRVKALHIHDNDGITDVHKAPYTGTIEWKSFYSALRKIGYEGDLSFETFRQTSPELIDPELMMPWFTLIAQIGDFFRKKIQE